MESHMWLLGLSESLLWGEMSTRALMVLIWEGVYGGISRLRKRGERKARKGSCVFKLNIPPRFSSAMLLLKLANH